MFPYQYSKLGIADASHDSRRRCHKDLPDPRGREKSKEHPERECQPDGNLDTLYRRADAIQHIDGEDGKQRHEYRCERLAEKLAKPAQFGVVVVEYATAFRVDGAVVLGAT